LHVTVEVPAKVNLCLLVGPPRPDGYHPVFTVLVPIDLRDRLEFALRARRADGGGERGADDAQGDLEVLCAGAPGEANLVAKAVRALELDTGWALEGTVRVTKGIPMGAGLGGGSSDAAAALNVGLAVLGEAGGPPPSSSTVVAMARTLGADVPFFLDPAPSIGRGIGDLIETLPLPGLELVLVFVDRGLATPQVYRAFDSLGPGESAACFETRAQEAEASWAQLSRDWTAGQIKEEVVAARVAPLLRNDLEKASFSLLPLLGETRQVIREEGGHGILMSGSGSTLFSLCRSGDEAAALTERLVKRGLLARRVRTGLATGLSRPPSLS
jgi:4-diphosphocytidyl-2-C-methyl-D-erythritol kinase